MSDYIKLTIHPETKQPEEAEWLDDYFGRHNYGVRFPSNGMVFRADEFSWSASSDPLGAVVGKLIADKMTTSKTAVGKRYDTTQHSDGSKDVNVKVNSIDVDETDEATIKAKEVIEKEVIPKLANRIVTAVVIHKPTNNSTSTKIKLPRVREWAQFVVDQFKNTIDGQKALMVSELDGIPVENEFIIVEVDQETGDAKVTTLEKYVS